MFVVRFVGPGDPVEQPAAPREPRQGCLQHLPRIRFERFDRICGAWVEIDPRLPPSNVATPRAEHE